MSPRTGRPIESDARHEKLNLRLNVDEKKLINDCAEELGITRTDAVIQGIKLLLAKNKRKSAKQKADFQADSGKNN